jgi:hypothetical protein
MHLDVRRFPQRELPRSPNSALLDSDGPASRSRGRIRSARGPAAFLALLWALATSGCASHSIRPGTWVLTFRAQDQLTGEVVDGKHLEHTVEVELDWYEGPNSNTIGEVVRISAQPDAKLPQIKGNIAKLSEDNPTPTISLAGEAEDWIFRMVGRVVDEEHIAGREFKSRLREDPDTILIGRWEMTFKE